MRIAIVNKSARVVGGVERYLDTIVEPLRRRGCEIAFVAEYDASGAHAPIRLSEREPLWIVAKEGEEKVVGALREWAPDVLYAHSVDDLDLESTLLDAAPSVRFVHDFNGTCVSRTKTHAFPHSRPCSRRFGLGCLALYFPRRCGGLSPLTMIRNYGAESRRRALLARYDALLVASDFMRDELIRNGLDGAKVERLRLPIVKSRDAGPFPAPVDDGVLRLLFVGRMERNKGGHVLLDALQTVAMETGRSVEAVFAGDGSDRAAWQRRAGEIERATSKVVVRFAGWLDEAHLAGELERAHLLVVPSLWPEPFGMVGVEAALCGVPAAAFAVGGIPEWLVDGRNGCLATEMPPNAADLARAIARCVSDPDRYSEMRREAASMARAFALEPHVDRLATALAAAAAVERTEVTAR